MRMNKGKETVTVEALLRLKRNEQPSEDFWSTFENDFERRRLNALLERESPPHPFWTTLLKGASVALPALFLGAVTYIWMGSDSLALSPIDQVSKPVAEMEGSEVSAPIAPNRAFERDEAMQLAVSEGPLKSQFVLDALREQPDRTLNFRKVLYTPAIHLSSPSGSFYVNDSLSSRNYRVTTADAKLGRNF